MNKNKSTSNGIVDKKSAKNTKINIKFFSYIPHRQLVVSTQCVTTYECECLCCNLAAVKKKDCKERSNHEFNKFKMNS